MPRSPFFPDNTIFPWSDFLQKGSFYSKLREGKFFGKKYINE